MTKFVIATPAYGDVFYTPYVSSVLKLARAMSQRKWDFIFTSISYAEIAESRNYLLSYWFDKSDASHILFIDADMGFDPQLIVDMVEFDKPVVGTIYPKRNIDVNRVAELAAKGEPLSRAIGRAHQYVFRRLPRDRQAKTQDGFMEVAGCGTGILLIQRACIAKMIRAMPEIIDKDKANFALVGKDLERVIRAFDVVRVGGQRLSEDYSFCHRWQALCKGEIWVSTKHEIVHCGLHQFRARYSDTLPGVVSGRLTVPIKTRVTNQARVSSGRIQNKAK